jgi:hypothetical protein
MSRMTATRSWIVSLAACVAMAGCYRSEPARESAATPAAAPAPEQAQAAAAEPPASPSPGANDGSTPSEPPRMASSHGPMPGIGMPGGGGAGDAGGAPGGAPGGAIHPNAPSPHGLLRWDAPAGWVQETPSNPMRAAQYRLPAAGGDADDGECVVFYFGPGQGGDAASNASRWVSMFTTPDGGPVQGKVAEEPVNGRKVTRVEAAGVYHAMAFGGQAPPPPKAGSMMLGAIVPGGDANWFFRCVGPQKTVSATRGAFDALVKSIH